MCVLSSNDGYRSTRSFFGMRSRVNSESKGTRADLRRDNLSIVGWRDRASRTRLGRITVNNSDSNRFRIEDDTGRIRFDR